MCSLTKSKRINSRVIYTSWHIPLYTRTFHFWIPAFIRFKLWVEDKGHDFTAYRDLDKTNLKQLLVFFPYVVISGWFDDMTLQMNGGSSNLKVRNLVYKVVDQSLQWACLKRLSMLTAEFPDSCVEENKEAIEQRKMASIIRLSTGRRTIPEAQNASDSHHRRTAVTTGLARPKRKFFCIASRFFE